MTVKVKSIQLNLSNPAKPHIMVTVVNSQGQISYINMRDMGESKPSEIVDMSIKRAIEEEKAQLAASQSKKVD